MDDLDGTAWEVTLSYTSIDAETGFETKSRRDATWTIRKLTTYSLGVHQEIGAAVDDFRALYRNGTLWLGRATEGDLADAAIVAVLEVSGKPGKLRISGSYMSYLGFDITKAKLKAKQVPAL
jgi:hypothetical protein